MVLWARHACIRTVVRARRSAYAMLVHPVALLTQASREPLRVAAAEAIVADCCALTTAVCTAFSHSCGRGKVGGLKASMLLRLAGGNKAVGVARKKNARPGHRVTIRDNHSRP